MSRLKLLLGLILSAFVLVSIQAQPGAATCAPLIERALEQLGSNCDGLGRNSICYGYTIVQASLASDAEGVEFDAPRDRAALELISSIRNAPLNEETETWGITVMNTQANLPGTLPGQGVVMMMIGETEITDATVPGTLPDLTPVSGQLVSAEEGARVRTGAGFNFNVARVVDPGTEIQVDGRSTDGQWLRIIAADGFGWIFADLLSLSDGQTAEDLPVVEDIIQSPMQSVYFRSGIGNPDCDAAPNALAVQSPRGTTVSITVNDAEIIISSTVVLETRDDNTMILYVIDGTAFVNNLVIPAGFKAFVPIVLREDILSALEAEGVTIIQTAGTTTSTPGLPAVDGLWRTCDPISNDDRVWLSTLQNIPVNLLSYAIQRAPDSEAVCAAPEVLAQQQQQQSPVIGSVDCRGFGATSPLNGMNWGTQTFYWDAASGASSYRVEVFDANSTVVASSTTNGLTATLDTGTQNETGGVTYAWSVAALTADGTVACQTDTVAVTRGAAPPSFLNRNSVEPSSPSSSSSPSSPSSPFPVNPPPVCTLDSSTCFYGVEPVECRCITCEEFYEGEC